MSERSTSELREGVGRVCKAITTGSLCVLCVCFVCLFLVVFYSLCVGLFRFVLSFSVSYDYVLGGGGGEGGGYSTVTVIGIEHCLSTGIHCIVCETKRNNDVGQLAGRCWVRISVLAQILLHTLLSH